MWNFVKRFFIFFILIWNYVKIEVEKNLGFLCCLKGKLCKEDKGGNYLFIISSML